MDRYCGQNVLSSYQLLSSTSLAKTPHDAANLVGRLLHESLGGSSRPSICGPAALGWVNTARAAVPHDRRGPPIPESHRPNPKASLPQASRTDRPASSPGTRPSDSGASDTDTPARDSTSRATGTAEPAATIHTAPAGDCSIRWPTSLTNPWPRGTPAVALCSTGPDRWRQSDRRDRNDEHAGGGSPWALPCQHDLGSPDFPQPEIVPAATQPVATCCLLEKLPATWLTRVLRIHQAILTFNCRVRTTHRLPSRLKRCVIRTLPIRTPRRSLHGRASTCTSNCTQPSSACRVALSPRKPAS